MREFLEAAERPAMVVAGQMGATPTAADACVDRALAEFAASALRLRPGDWPAAFWGAFVDALGSPPATLPAPATRLAVLLRALPGLDVATLARSLPAAPGDVARALARGVPPAADGQPDALAWASLRATLEAEVAALPLDRLRARAAHREAVLARVRAPRLPNRRGPLAAVAGLAGLALAGTYVLEARVGTRVSSEALAPARAPASRYAPQPGLVAHPDFAMLADPAAERLAADAGFLAWSAAEADRAQAALPAPVTTVEALVPILESADAP